MKRLVPIGLIGAGCIGRSHWMAVRAVGGAFPGCRINTEPYIPADEPRGRSEAEAAALDVPRATADWLEAVDAADAIAMRRHAHAQSARRPISQGKPVLREKPLGLASGQAQSLVDSAAAAGVVNAVGFAYLRSPLIRRTRRLIEEGTLALRSAPKSTSIPRPPDDGSNAPSTPLNARGQRRDRQARD